jgi:pimeloyl-ACP methyl ester carboxylesterase
MRFLIYLSSLSLMVGAAAQSRAAAPPVNNGQIDYNASMPVLINDRSLLWCNLNVIVPSLNGQYLAIWRDDQKELNEATEYNFSSFIHVFDKKTKHKYIISGDMRNQPLFWKDNTLYFRYGPKKIFKTDGATVEQVLELPDIAEKVRFRSKSFWTMSPEDIKAAISKIDPRSPDYARYLLFGNSGILAGVKNYGEMKVFDIIKQKNITKYKALYYTDLHVIQKNQKYEYSYLGYKNKPYTYMPIKYEDGTLENEYIIPKQKHIKSSVITLNKSRYFLYDSENNETYVHYDDGDQNKSEKICSVMPVDQYDPEIKAHMKKFNISTFQTFRNYNPDTVKFDKKIHGLYGGGLIDTALKKTDKLIIFIHGGPTVSAITENPHIIKTNINDASQYDILVIDYPGSVGFGDKFTHLFTKYGPNIFDQYANIINDWAIKNKYKDIIIISNSFGSLPALSLMNKADDKVKASIFFAPLLSKDHQINEKSKFRIVSPTSHANSSKLTYGIYGENSYIKNWVYTKMNVTNCAKCLFVFGDKDTMSRRDDLDQKYIDKSIFVASQHMFVMSNPKGWDFVNKSLEQLNK